MKTHKFTISLLIMLFLTLLVNAKLIETNDAATVGKNYYWENARVFQMLTYDKLELNLFKTEMQNGIPVYYVFNVNNNGFILVSADDKVQPVLGYSAEGTWTGENIPPALIQKLAVYKQQISDVITMQIEGGDEIAGLWKKYEKYVAAPDGTKAVSPLLVTTWNQDTYYNKQCPADPAGPDGHAYAGCVAVSMAQVMYYHQHPAQGIGSNTYAHPTYGTISANFGTTTYNYATMPLALNTYNTQVAQFMFHCGVAVDMNYGPSGSAPMGTYWDTDIENALKNNFDYSSTLNWKWKNSYNNATWISMLKSELDLSRPLIYYGWDGNNMAHNFNCDGYDNNNNFHFNWGWGGYYDGYFPVTNLNPASGYNYTYYQGAIFDMTPNQTPPVVDYDWGDAPDNPGYPTLSANNGARHKVTTPPTLFLGTLVDTETDGQPHINCTGDDNNNLDDEDGVTFPQMTVGSTVTINVIAQGYGILDAWMDFNQDGDWADANEKIFALTILNTGTHALTLNIPASAGVGWTYARFRFSSQGNLSYNGAASDGEVEDYFIRINEEGGTSVEKNILFSLDIGSDTEMSDPAMDMDEVFDPGDAYLFQGTFMPFPGTDGIIDDAGFFGIDPLPDGGVAGTGAPCMSGLPIDMLKLDFFDMDGLDLALCDLRQYPMGEGLPPIEKFDDPFIHDPDSMYISFDDDDAFPYTDPSGSIPRSGFSPIGMLYGQQQNKDEILEVDFNLSYPLQGQVMSILPKYDEVSIHQNLTPDPDFYSPNGPNEHDDDVDALDAPVNLEDVTRTYFSADHEATSVDFTGQPLNPGSIYLANNGMAIEVINAQMHIGLFPETDIDAFEFTWAIEPQYNYMALAMIFSVDDNDPTTPADESGGMSPNDLYITFMTGWWMPLTVGGFEDDIDAITIFATTGGQAPKADFSPLNSTLYAGQNMVFTDLSTQAPTSWNWTFTGGNPANFNGTTPPPVIYSTPGTFAVSLTVTNAFGTDTKTGSLTVLPSTWQYTSTNISHIITIPLTVNPTVNGTPLAAGDLIGVFYTDNNGYEMCGGHAAWDGVNNISVSAFCDDITTTPKDGFVNGEILTWKVFTWSTLNTSPVSVSYDQSLPHYDGNYYDWGISALTSLNTYISHSVAMFKGWQGISSYVVPTNPNLDTLLAPVLSKLVIMQNFSGVYWPSVGVNTLINWNVYDGYVVKMSQDAVLNIQGSAVSNRTINLTPGWHLVPVLSSNAVAASSLFNIPEVMLVKEVAGSKVYWPTMGITSLNVLMPGEAYYVYVLSPVSIGYPAKSAPAGNSKNILQPTINSPWTLVLPSPNSHLVAIPESISVGFSEGTILGAFNSAGLCVGTTPITGKDNILTIYGDDITTPEIDGMIEYEDIVYKLYNQATGEDVILNPDFDTEKLDAGSTFKTNGLSILKSVTNLEEITTFGNLSIYPNPASNYIRVNLGEATASAVSIELMNIIGDIMVKVTSNNATEVIDVSGLAEGCYIIRVSNHSETISKKIVIRK